jgi:hypothetical protein
LLRQARRGGNMIIFWSRQICLFAFCMGAAIRVRPAKHTSWLHHLVLVFLTGMQATLENERAWSSYLDVEIPPVIPSMKAWKSIPLL